MTQREVVLRMLKRAGSEGVRSDAFFEAHLPRAAARILELKDEGYEISTEREGKFVRYRLLPDHHGPRTEARVTSGNDRPDVTEGESAAESRLDTSGGLERSVPSFFDHDADWDSAA